MAQYNKFKNKEGQSLFEVVVALTLISIVLITLVSMASLSIRSSVFSRTQSEASRFTEEATEWLQEEKDTDWSIFYAHAGTANWCFDKGLTWNNPGNCPNGEVISGTVLQRSLTFSNLNGNSVTALVVTSWKDGEGSHSAPSTVIFTNWK